MVHITRDITTITLSRSKPVALLFEFQTVCFSKTSKIKFNLEVTFSCITLKMLLKTLKVENSLKILNSKTSKECTCLISQFLMYLMEIFYMRHNIFY